MSLAKITLWGMYEHGVDIQDDLFKNWILPSDMDADLLKDNILLKGAEFEVVYANFPFMQNAIKIWSQKYYRTFERWLKALAIEYNPLENYDRMEEWQDGSNRNKSGNRNDIQNRINALSSSELAQHGETKTDASSSMEATGHTDSKSNTSDSIEATGRTEGKASTEAEQMFNVTEKADTETSSANSVNTSNADTTHGSTMEHQTSAFNSSTYAPKDKDILTGDNTSNDATSGTATVGGRSGSGEETAKGLESKNSTENGTSNDIITRTGSGTDSGDSNDITSRSGSGSESLTGNEARSKTDAGNESLTSAGNDKESEQQSSIHTGRMHGNIGVTTSQQMLEAEWQVAKLNIYEEAADLFLTELCIYTY